MKLSVIIPKVLILSCFPFIHPAFAMEPTNNLTSSDETSPEGKDIAYTLAFNFEVLMNLRYVHFVTPLPEWNRRASNDASRLVAKPLSAFEVLTPCRGGFSTLTSESREPIKIEKAEEVVDQLKIKVVDRIGSLEDRSCVKLVEVKNLQESETVDRYIEVSKNCIEQTRADPLDRIALSVLVGDTYLNKSDSYYQYVNEPYRSQELAQVRACTNKSFAELRKMVRLNPFKSSIKFIDPFYVLHDELLWNRLIEFFERAGVQDAFGISPGVKN